MLQRFGYARKQFLVWFLANLLGFGALGISILVFPTILGKLGFYATTFILALPISLAQWIVLWRIQSISILWILTIPIAIPLSFLVLELIPAGFWFEADNDSVLAMTSMFLVVGLMIGLLQWIILRRQLARAATWLFGSSIGVAGSFWFIAMTGLLDHSGVMAYVVVALIYAGTTGLFLSGIIACNHELPSDLAEAT
jgi:hypothetical protein